MQSHRPDGRFWISASALIGMRRIGKCFQFTSIPQSTSPLVWNWFGRLPASSPPALLSKYLAMELVVAFLKTNNPIKYHHFGSWCIRKGKSKDGKTWSLPDMGGPTTLVAKFLNYMVYTYGSWNGKLGKKRWMDPITGEIETIPLYQRQEEGGQRLGPTSNHPQLDYSLWESLSSLNDVVDQMNSQEPSLVGYKAAVKAILDSLQGVKTLFSQKIITLSVMVGLVEDMRWMGFILPGSPSHFDGLLGEPFNLQTRSQIPQCIIFSQRDWG